MLFLVPMEELSPFLIIHRIGEQCLKPVFDILNIIVSQDILYSKINDIHISHGKDQGTKPEHQPRRRDIPYDRNHGLFKPITARMRI